MVLKSFAKINLSLSINSKLANGLHNIQSIFCLVNIFDKIQITKIKKKNININKDKISFYGPYSSDVENKNNSIEKTLNILRDQKIISDFYSIKVFKNIPVFAGLGGGSSNAATVLNFFVKKKNKRKIINKAINQVGSDIRLFFYTQGFLRNLDKVDKLKNNFKLHFLIIYPKIRCSTKNIFLKVKKFSKRVSFSNRFLKDKTIFLKRLKLANNDLQSIVEKKHPIISKLLEAISNEKGCLFSRLTGSGSVCYGLFINENSSKVALKSLRKKYPNFWISIAKTI